MNGKASSALQKLDSETCSKIRSTQILTSLPQIVSELVQNSLDAGAKNVEIGMDMTEWACWVRDDGAGMNKSGLELIAQGCERGRYATSKAYNPSSLDHITTFGFRGEALASAADLSCLEIASRTCRSKESWSLIVRGGKTLYHGPSTRWHRERAGTTVSVRDAFYNLPIRRLSHPISSRTIELIRRDIEALALVFPSISFSVEDCGRDRTGTLAKSRVLSIPKTNTTLKAFRHMYGRTLVEHVEEVYEERDSLKIEGFLSLVGSLTKAYQFIFVNKHILDVCDLHRIIDQKFGASSFAKNALDEAGETALPRTSARRSPRKNERKSAYVLNITIPPCQIDNCLEPAKTAVHFRDQKPIVNFLADIIERFLVRHGFRKEKTDHDLASAPAAKKRKVEDGTQDHFHLSGGTTESTRSSKRIEEKEIIIKSLDPTVEDDSTTWTDPSSGRVYTVDRRTGNSYLKDREVRGCIASRRILDVPWQKGHRDPCIHNPSQDSNGEMPNWMKEALQGNKVFAPTERGIRDIPLRGPFDEDDFGGNQSRLRRRQFVETLPDSKLSLGSVGIPSQSAFTRECVAGALVIEQLDRKFIVCLVDLPTSSNNKHAEHSADNREIITTRTLVLVDQHAADERVRVERYLKTLCLGFLDRDGVGIERRRLNPPISVLLSSTEYVNLHDSDRAKTAFRRWGFDVCENEGKADPEHGYATLYIKAVPEMVADKLLSGPDLSEFVKGFLARLEAEGLEEYSPIRDEYLTEICTVPTTADSELAWLKALRFCPRELVELINSKACRGAIMFNDELTIEQCRRLMRQLSRTAFPFQCAHGRPSMVPLTTVPAEAKDEMTRPVDWSALAGKWQRLVTVEYSVP